MASRSVALLLASRFLGDLGSGDVWAVSVLSDGLEPTPDGEHEQLVVVELRRLSDGAAGYATLTGAAPGDVARRRPSSSSCTTWFWRTRKAPHSPRAGDIRTRGVLVWRVES